MKLQNISLQNFSEDKRKYFKIPFEIKKSFQQSSRVLKLLKEIYIGNSKTFKRILFFNNFVFLNCSHIASN